MREDYPPPPNDDEIDDLLYDRDAPLYLELFEGFLRTSEFSTAIERSVYGDRAVYQTGGTCYLAACLNIAVHVPELRNYFFAFFRLKHIAVDRLTNEHFQLLGNFASEPLGTSLLALGESLRERSMDYTESILQLGSARALMRAFMLRIPGFDQLREDVIQAMGEHTVTGRGGPAATRARRLEHALMHLFANSPDVRAGIVSANDDTGGRHVVAFVRDMSEGGDGGGSGVRVFNWGVSDTYRQLHNFIKHFPLEIEIVIYSLESDHVKRLKFDAPPRPKFKYAKWWKPPARLKRLMLR